MVCVRVIRKAGKYQVEGDDDDKFAYLFEGKKHILAKYFAKQDEVNDVFVYCTLTPQKQLASLGYVFIPKGQK